MPHPWINPSDGSPLPGGVPGLLSSVCTSGLNPRPLCMSSPLQLHLLGVLHATTSCYPLGTFGQTVPYSWLVTFSSKVQVRSHLLLETFYLPKHSFFLTVKVAQSCPTLCDPIDCSLSGSSAHGILWARILEWVAIPFSRGSSQPRDRT